MDSFQRFAPNARFAPEQVADIASNLEREGSRRISDLQRQQGQQEQRAQNLIQDSQLPNYTMEALSQFSKTASKFVEDYAKRTAKDIEVGSQFDSIYNPTLSPEEESIVNAATVQQATAGQAANALEAEGDDIGAENLRSDLNRVGQGLQDERALLTSARTNYAGDVLGIIDSNSQLSQLFATDPGRAMEIATKIFIEQNGLQYTTKRNFVDIMGGTIRNVIQNTTTQQMTQIIKERRTERLAENDAKASNLLGDFTASSDAANTVRYQELSEDYMLDNNGILTQGAANRRAASTLLTAAANKGDQDLIEAIGRVQVIPNEQGTGPTIASTFPDLYLEAKNEAPKARQAAIRARRGQVLDELGQSLQGIEDPYQRLQLIEQARESLGSDFQGVLQLNDAYPELVADPDATATYMQLSDQISNGQTMRDEDIEQRVASGKLTRALGDKLKRENAARLKPATERATAIGKRSTGRLRSLIQINTGAKADPTGFLSYDTTVSADKRPFDSTTANNIVGSYDRDLKTYLKDLIQGINVTEYTPEQLDQQIREWSSTFYKEQAIDPNGTYYLGGLFTGGPVSFAKDPERYRDIRGAARNFGQSVRSRSTNGVDDWTDSWDLGMSAKPLEGKYEFGDIIMDEQEVSNMVSRVKQEGIYPEIGRIARDLKVLPQEFVESQARAYNLEIGNVNVAGARKRFTNVNIKADNPDYWLQAAETVPYFIANGYTPQGAAWAAVALQYRARQLYEVARPPGDFFGNILRNEPKDYFGNTDWLNVIEDDADLRDMKKTQKELANALRKMYPQYKQNWAAELDRMIRHSGYK
jgi:hypothetical protein